MPETFWFCSQLSLNIGRSYWHVMMKLFKLFFLLHKINLYLFLWSKSFKIILNSYTQYSAGKILLYIYMIMYTSVFQYCTNKMGLLLMISLIIITI